MGSGRLTVEPNPAPGQNRREGITKKLYRLGEDRFDRGGVYVYAGCARCFPRGGEES